MDMPPIYTLSTKGRKRVDRERHQRMQELRLRGREPFPDARLLTRSLAAEIHAEHDPFALESGEHRRWCYTVAGRLMARRKHRHATFIDLRDQSGIIELCVRGDNPDKTRCSPLIDADLGDIVTAEGTIYVTDNHALTRSRSQSFPRNSWQRRFDCRPDEAHERTVSRAVIKEIWACSPTSQPVGSSKLSPLRQRLSGSGWQRTYSSRPADPFSMPSQSARSSLVERHRGHHFTYDWANKGATNLNPPPQT
jgi:hypothetical protein